MQAYWTWFIGVVCVGENWTKKADAVVAIIFMTILLSQSILFTHIPQWKNEWMNDDEAWCETPLSIIWTHFDSKGKKRKEFQRILFRSLLFFFIILFYHSRSMAYAQMQQVTLSKSTRREWLDLSLALKHARWREGKLFSAIILYLCHHIGE